MKGRCTNLAEDDDKQRNNDSFIEKEIPSTTLFFFKTGKFMLVILWQLNPLFE